MAASRETSKAATLPPRVAPPRQKRQTEPPSTTQSFLGRIKRKFRFKNKDSGYDFGEPINVQGVYFRRKSGEFSNSKDGEVQMAGNYSGRIEVSRSMSERYASKPVSKLSKFKIGMRGYKSAKNSNIVLESEHDGNISPRMSLSLGNEERVICQNDYLTSENNIIDLDGDYKLTNTAVLDDVDPGYETLDEVREKLRNLKKSKPETVSGLSNRTHRETNSSHLSHKRSLSSGTPRQVFEGLSTFSSGSETGLSMPAEVYHYDRDTSSSPILYRQNLKDFNESEVSTSPVIPSHRRCHSERFQLPPDATLTTRTGSCPIEVQDQYYPRIGFYGDENTDNSPNKAGSDTLWKETVDIYANPNIVSKKSSGVYSDERRSSYQEPEIENEDSTPPIPDRKYSMEGIVDLMGGDLEPDSPEEQGDVHICSANTSETEVPYNVHFSDHSFHPTSHTESKHSLPLQMFESENLHRDYLYESIDECKRKMKVTSTEIDEEDDDYDDAWDNEESVAAKLVKSAVCELNSPSVLYESVDDCRKKESLQYAFSQNRFSDQLSNQNQDAFISLKATVTEEGLSKNLSSSIAPVDVPLSSVESEKVCSKEKSSNLICNDSKNVEERPKNIWKFKREHLYAEIDDLQNEDQIRQHRQIRNRIESKEIVHFENTDKEKSLLNADISEPSQTGRCISKGLTHNPEFEYLEDVSKCECSTSYMTQKQLVDCESVNHRNTSVSVRSGEEPFLSNSSSEVKLKSNEFKDSCFSTNDTLEDFHELKKSVERLSFDQEGEINYQCEANSLGHERTTCDTYDDRKSCDNFSSTSDIDASECSKSSYRYNYYVSNAFPIEYDVSSPGNVNLRSSLSPGELHISTEDNTVINPPMLTPTSSSTIYYGGMTASLELPNGEEIVSTDIDSNDQALSSVPTDTNDTNIRHLVKLKPMSAFINLIDEFGMFYRDRDFETSMGSSNTDDSLDTACNQRDTSISYEETADSVLENLSFHNDAMSEGFSSTENLLDYDSSKETPAQNSFEAETTEKSAHKSKIVTNHLDASTKEVPESSDITMTSDCLNSVNFEDTDVENNRKIEESSVEYSQNIDGAVADVSQKRLPNYFYDDDEPIHMSISDLYPSKYQETNATSSVSVNRGILRNKSGRSSPMKKSTSCVIGNSGPSSNVTEQRRNVRSTIDERPPAIIPRRVQQESECRKDFWDSMRQLKDCGWYWGPMSWDEAEMKLANKPDGSFLVRDSSNDRYLLSLSFNTNGHVHHTRIEHHKGKFSFWSQPDSLRKATIQEFIEKCIRNSQNGQFLYFIRPAGPGAPPIAVHLLYPVSRFKQMQSLQHICRFNIVQRVRRDHIDQLPIPKRIKDYLKESQYYVEYLED